MDHTSCYSTHQTPYHSALGWLDACKVSIVTRKTTHYTWELPPYCTLVKAMYSAPLLNNKLHDSHRRIVYIIPDTAPRSTPRRSPHTTLCLCASLHSSLPLGAGPQPAVKHRDARRARHVRPGPGTHIHHQQHSLQTFSSPDSLIFANLKICHLLNNLNKRE